MSLRLRLAIIVAMFVAGTAATVAAVAHVSAEREFNKATDRFLVERSEQIVTAYNITTGNRRPARPGGRDRGDQLLQTPDAVTQIINRQGAVVDQLNDAVVLPVTDADLRHTNDNQRPTLRDETIEGVDYRVITRNLNDDLAVQVARRLDSNEEALRGLDNRLIAVGLAGVALAALAGWGVAHRLARPVQDLAAQAAHVARTQRFDATIDVPRNDEVGTLASSFNEMLRALDRSKRQQHRLVQDASHELRTPLTSVRTNIEVLRSQHDKLSDDQRQLILTDLEGEVGALSALVGELVDLATDAGGDPEPHEPVDVGALAEVVANRFRRAHDRAIAVDLAVISPTASGSASDIERAIINLVTNAIKFSADDTPITVALASAPGELRVEVRDEGSGIPPGDLERVFDRFYRADETRTVPGSGLGLAIVDQVAERHGGSTWARNLTPTGAAVGFSLRQ